MSTKLRRVAVLWGCGGVLALSCLFLLVIGCDVVAPGGWWHKKYRWIAEDYFDDPQVVALCHAIEADDLPEIERLVKAGANVNARGKDNMTPLLWSFPENKPERFQKLLELGADPNVRILSDLNTKSGLIAGDSVTSLVCGTRFPEFFDLVFQHGGDPNLKHPFWDCYPLHLVIRGMASEKPKKIHRLLELGADIDANLDNPRTNGRSPVVSATLSFAQFDLALQLLEAGADYKTYQANTNKKFVHTVAGQERNIPRMNPEKKAQFQKLVAWLEARGESMEEARADIKRWQSAITPAQVAAMRKSEMAARKARETNQIKDERGE